MPDDRVQGRVDHLLAVWGDRAPEIAALALNKVNATRRAADITFALAVTAALRARMSGRPDSDEFDSAAD